MIFRFGFAKLIELHFQSGFCFISLETSVNNRQQLLPFIHFKAKNPLVKIEKLHITFMRWLFYVRKSLFTQHKTRDRK